MVIADAAGLPIAAYFESASPHEVKLAETALVTLFIAENPEKLIGDKAYDRDKLDNDLLKKQCVEDGRSPRTSATARSQKLRIAES